MYLEVHPWKEYHKNGQLWIDGQIALVAESSRHLYKYLTGFPSFEGRPVCRIGVWTKYYENGQKAWSFDYGDGTHDYKTKQELPSYRTSGEVIV